MFAEVAAPDIERQGHDGGCSGDDRREAGSIARPAETGDAVAGESSVDGDDEQQPGDEDQVKGTVVAARPFSLLVAEELGGMQLLRCGSQSALT